MLLEQVRTIDKHRLKEKMGKLDDDAMQRVNEAIGNQASAFTIHISKGRKNRAVSEKLRAARFALYLCFVCTVRGAKQDFAVIRKLAAQHSV